MSQVWTDQHSVGRLGHGSAFLAPFSSLSDARDPRGPVCAPGAVFLRLGRPVAYRARSRPSRHARAVIIRIGRFVPLGAGFRTFRPFSSAWPSRWRSHARCRFHPFCAVSPTRGAVFTRLGLPSSSAPVCAVWCTWARVCGRRGTAGPSATPGPVFARLCRSVPLAARPGHLGLPVPFFAVFLSRSHPPKPFPSSLARFFCRPGALAICAIRRPFPSSSGSRCRFQPFCAVSATRGALFIRLGLPSPSAPACGARLACFSLSWPPRAPVPFFTVSAVSCP